MIWKRGSIKYVREYDVERDVEGIWEKKNVNLYVFFLF